TLVQRINGNGVADDGDRGYWVNFEYEHVGGARFWRAPFEGTQMDHISLTAVDNYSTGLRENVLLSKIETSTHVADFHRQGRYDNRMAAPDPELQISGKSVDILNGKVSNIYDHAADGWAVPGDWTAILNQASANQKVISIWDPVKQSHRWNYTKSDFSSVTYVPANASDRGGLGYTLFHLKSHQSNSQAYQDAAGTCFFWVGALMNGGGSNYALKQIDIKKKETNTVISSVAFKYDYSLCPNTPNSTSNQAQHSGNQGKLTLKEVRTYGNGGIYSGPSLPPYKFEYANGDAPGTGMNPAFHQEAYTNWGNYRDGNNGQDLDPFKHQTPQSKTRADRSAAWSLTKVTLPTGGHISFEYESDDYYHVGTAIDIEKLAVPARLKGKSYAISTGLYNSTATIPFLGDTVTVNTPSQATSFKIRSSIGNLYKLEKGDQVAILIRKILANPSPTQPGKKELSAKHRMVLRTVKDVFKTGANTIVTLEEALPTDDFPFNPIHRDFTLFTSPDKIYGGGARIKSITSFDGSSNYSIHYDYSLDNGRSSGVASALPRDREITKAIENSGYQRIFEGAQYAASGQVAWNTFTENPAFELNRVDNLDKDQFLNYVSNNPKSYNLSAPGVLYSQVTVTPKDDTGTAIEGKTRFQFFTAKDGLNTPHNTKRYLDVIQCSVMKNCVSHGCGFRLNEIVSTDTFFANCEAF
ncbi:MAG: hypothetical protein AAF570_15235, partial [Bacteroidota bacterium]